MSEPVEYRTEFQGEWRTVNQPAKTTRFKAFVVVAVTMVAAGIVAAMVQKLGLGEVPKPKPHVSPMAAGAILQLMAVFQGLRRVPVGQRLLDFLLLLLLGTALMIASMWILN